MEIFKVLLSLFTDTKHHFSTKAAVFIAIVLGACLLNDITGFNYYYNLNHKVESIKSINEILKDSAALGEDRAQLIALRGQVLNHKDIIESVADKTRSVYRSIKYRNIFTHSSDNTVSINHSIAMKYASRNDFAFLITSSCFYIILMVIILPMGIYTFFKGGELVNSIVGIVAAELLLAIPVALSYYIFGLIPLIGNNWTWNYLLNFVLQIVFLFLIGASLTKANKKSA